MDSINLLDLQRKLLERQMVVQIMRFQNDCVIIIGVNTENYWAGTCSFQIILFTEEDVHYEITCRDHEMEIAIALCVSSAMGDEL